MSVFREYPRTTVFLVLALTFTILAEILKASLGG